MDVGFLHLSLPFQAQVELELPAKQSLLFLFSEKKSKLNERMTEEKNLIPLRTSLPGLLHHMMLLVLIFRLGSIMRAQPTMGQ